jgi:hypothetical protein
MSVTEHLTIIAVALGVAVPWSIWLWFMLVMPKRWAAFIEWENAVCVRTGLLSKRWAEILKALETGVTLKVIVALTIAISMAILFKR